MTDTVQTVCHVLAFSWLNYFQVLYFGKILNSHLILCVCSQTHTFQKDDGQLVIAWRKSGWNRHRWSKRHVRRKPFFGEASSENLASHHSHKMCVPFHWPHRQASHEIFNSQSCWILHPWVLQLVCPQPTMPSVLSRNSSPHWVFNWLWQWRRSGGCQQFTRWNCWKESSKAAIPIWHTMACYCWLHRENFRPIWCFENPFPTGLL